MEKIEVTAHFDNEGRITPQKIVWQGRSFNVEGTGRRWEAKDKKHILVMVAGNQIFHLIFDLQTSIWKLVTNDELPSLAQV